MGNMQISTIECVGGRIEIAQSAKGNYVTVNRWMSMRAVRPESQSSQILDLTGLTLSPAGALGVLAITLQKPEHLVINRGAPGSTSDKSGRNDNKPRKADKKPDSTNNKPYSTGSKPRSISNYRRAGRIKHLLWECCWYTWKS